MKVAVVTSPRKTAHEIDTIISLFSNGLDVLHLRKPKATDGELEIFLQQIPEEYYSRIIIHGHYKLVLKYRLKGIHLNKEHRKASLKNKWMIFKLKLKRPDLAITTSFHSLKSLRSNKSQYDYVFFTAIFSEKTHYSVEEDSGMNLLRKAISDSKLKIYALGGVEETKLETIRAAGFHGIGLSSSIWNNANPNEALIQPYIAA